MARLTNAKHEAFALGLAEGMSGAASYREHVAEPGAKTSTCMVNASTLLSEPNVSLRVSELRMSFADVLDKKLGVRQETVARFLVAVMETPVGEVNESEALCQEIRRSRRVVGKGEAAEEWETEHIKTPSKLDAADRLNKMAGWYAADKIETVVTFESPEESLKRAQAAGLDVLAVLSKPKE